MRLLHLQLIPSEGTRELVGHHLHRCLKGHHLQIILHVSALYFYASRLEINKET